MTAYCAAIYGMGGSILDPAGGMATLLAKIKAFGVDGPAQPFQEENIQQVADAVKAQASDTQIIIVGDSCGANKAPWVAAAVRPRRIAYMACIQASVYCQAGCPDIPDNVDEAFIVYSDWAHTGGLGTYIPVCETTPNNDGKTRYRQSYVPAFHPDDNDVLRIQQPIIADIKRIIGG
jgi:hypothetical protein